jgi:predicted dinucleotide-binding enzyme
MRVGVLGTGIVGETLAAKLVELGHDVMMGSRDASNEKVVGWAASHGDKASVGSLKDAAEFGHHVINCTPGMVSIEALKMAGEENLAGKVLLDVANPLDFSKGMPPSLSVCNTDSLGEQIQREFPKVKVVKSLNTVNCKVMTNPTMVKGGDHDLFICGNDDDAKAHIVDLLVSFGWEQARINDLGDITGARAMEMYLPLWVRLFVGLGSGEFNIKLVR